MHCDVNLYVNEHVNVEILYIYYCSYTGVARFASPC